MNDYGQIQTNTWNPYAQPTFTQPYYVQQGFQPTKPLTIEDRIATIEKDIKEIKDLLESIRRVI
jgi:hypothetical protein